MTSLAYSTDTDCSKGRTELRDLARADAHVRAYRSWRQAYGSWEGFYLHKARIAAARAEQMQTPEGRMWIWKRNVAAAVWRWSWNR